MSEIDDRLDDIEKQLSEIQDALNRLQDKLQDKDFENKTLAMLKSIASELHHFYVLKT